MKQCLTAALLATACLLTSSAQADERPDHYKGKAADTLQQAVANFSEYNQKLNTLLKAELTPLAMAVLTAIMASYGEAAVAAFGVGARLESIACLVVLALSMTLPPLVSQNFGAGLLHRVQQAYRDSGRFVMLWQFAVFVVLAALAPLLAKLFSSDSEVVRIICWFIWIVPLGYGLQGVIILTNSSFNALHRPGSALVLSIIRLFVFYVPLAWLGGQLYGVTGLFVGCVVANIITAAIAWHWFNRTLHTTKQERG